MPMKKNPTRRGKSDARKTRTLTLRLDEDTHEKMTRICAAIGGISQSAAMRLLIRTMSLSSDDRILDLANRIRELSTDGVAA